MTFVLRVLPIGLMGLLFAVIFSASMSSTSSGIMPWRTFAVDIYKKRLLKRDAEDKHCIAGFKTTLLFGAWLSLLPLLLPCSTILLSCEHHRKSVLWYHTRYFLTAFLLKRVKGHAVLQPSSPSVSYFTWTSTFVTAGHCLLQKIGYLWYNVIATGLVMVFSAILNRFFFFFSSRAHLFDWICLHVVYNVFENVLDKTYPEVR